MTKIGEFYGAEVNVETTLENKKGWIMEVPNSIKTKHLLETLISVAEPYRKYPILQEISYLLKQKKLDFTPNVIDAEIDEITILVKYKER